MLTRICSVSYQKEELDRYLTLLEEAKLRDHRKLGRELELFMTSEAGPGFLFCQRYGPRDCSVDY